MHSHEEFIVSGDFVLGLYSVIEIDAGYPAVGMNLNFLALDKLAPEGLLAIVLEVEDNLVPAVFEFEGHGALKGLDAGDGLVVAGDEGPLDVFIVEDGDFEAEVLIELY